MKRSILIALCSLMISGTASANSPWEGMKFMLDKSVLTADIREHCKTPSAVKDDDFVRAVLSNPENKNLIQVAANYRDKNNLTRYKETIAKVTCPTA